MVDEDFASFLANNSEIENFIVRGAGLLKKESYAKLGLFRKTHNIPYNICYKQQLEFKFGLVQFATKKNFGSILKLTRTEKERLHRRLETTKTKQFYLYALCEKILGLTYYDLLEIALEKHCLNNSRTKSDYLNKIERFDSPACVNKESLTSEEYEDLEQLLNESQHFPNNAGIQPTPWHDSTERIDLKIIWAEEYTKAINFILANAYQAISHDETAIINHFP